MSKALLTLQSFLALSEAMASAAAAQEWEEFVRLSEQRNALSPELPATLGVSLSTDELNQGKMIIERCMQLDAQTRGLVEDRKQALGILLREPSPTA